MTKSYYSSYIYIYITCILKWIYCTPSPKHTHAHTDSLHPNVLKHDCHIDKQWNVKLSPIWSIFSNTFAVFSTPSKVQHRPCTTCWGNIPGKGILSENVLLTTLPTNTVILHIECRYYSLFTWMKLPKYIGQTDAIRAKMIAQTCWLLLANWSVPADTRRKNNVVMTPKRHRDVIIAPCARCGGNIRHYIAQVSLIFFGMIAAVVGCGCRGMFCHELYCWTVSFSYGCECLHQMCSLGRNAYHIMYIDMVSPQNGWEHVLSGCASGSSSYHILCIHMVSPQYGWERVRHGCPSGSSYHILCIHMVSP